MKTKTFIAPVAGVAAALLSTAALGAISLTNGNATYTSTVGTTSAGSAGGTPGDFRPEGGATVDHLFRNTWHWRVNGVDTREFMFSSEAGFSFAETSVASVGTQSWTGLDGGRFNAVLTTALVDGGAAGQAQVTQSMSITNVSAGALSMAIFNFADFDVNNATSNSATLLTSDTIQITAGGPFVQHRGIGAANYGVAAFNVLFAGAGSLTDTAITNVANTGLPFGPADYTGAWQWNNAAIGIGQTVVFTSVFAVNQAVPAPSALALLGLGGLAASRRRRS